MNLGQYTPSQTEIDLINKHQFNVSVSGDRFVVRHPRFKKLGKIEGGNLSAAIYQMVDAEKKLLEHPRYAKMAEDDKAKDSNVVALKPIEDMPNYPGKVIQPQQDPDEIHNVVLDDSGGKPARQPKPKSPKRDPEKMAFFQAFKLWLMEPNAEPEKIYKKLTEMGIDTTVGSTKMLRHMCNTVVRAAIDLGFVTADGMKTRREEILKR